MCVKGAWQCSCAGSQASKSTSTGSIKGISQVSSFWCTG
jgi:hypothetical protein